MKTSRPLFEQIKASREIAAKAESKSMPADAATLARILSIASAATVARVLATASAATVDRALSTASDATLDRVLATASDATLARILATASDATLARALARASDATLDRVLARAEDLPGLAALRALVVPIVPDLDRQILAQAEAGKLRMDAWHCGTTHCIAGWAVTLGGEPGRRLDELLGTELAGRLIYEASTGRIAPDFFASDKEALAGLRRRAESARE